MDVQTAAVLLAILLIIGLFFIVYVLRIQIPLLKVRDTPLYNRVRYILFTIMLIILIGTLVLLSVDIATVFFGLERSSHRINPIGIVVTFTGAIVMMSGSIGFAVFYWLIGKDNAAATKLASKNKSDRETLQDRNDALQADNDKLNKR